MNLEKEQEKEKEREQRKQESEWFLINKKVKALRHFIMVTNYSMIEGLWRDYI